MIRAIATNKPANDKNFTKRSMIHFSSEKGLPEGVDFLGPAF